MLRNYFKIAIRNLWKNKIFSLVNIIGLSAGISVCIVVALFVHRENSVDAFHTKNMYRLDEVQKFEGLVEPQKVALSMFPMGPTLQSEFPEIVNYTRIFGEKKIPFLYKNKQIISQSLLWVDSAFFQVFDFKLLKGSKSGVLAKSGSIVLSKSMSEKLFGSEDPIGKTISRHWSDSMQFMVTGIMEDVPENSHLQMDIITVFPTETKTNNIANWGNNWVVTYLELLPNTNIGALEKKLPAYLKKHIGDGEKDYELFLQPLKEIHSSSTDITHDYFNYQKFDKRNTYVFILIAFIVLGIGCMNFINLSTARSVGRAKEVGIRKTVGASRSQLGQQFIYESLLYAFVAMLFSFVLVGLFLPYINHLSGYHLSYGLLAEAKSVCLLLVGTVLVGFISGIYPAFYLSSFKPALVLKGSIQVGKNKSVGRNLLVICQFSGAIFLVICTVFVVKQLHFMQSSDPGFSKDQVVSITLSPAVQEKYKILKQEFLKSPTIEYVTGSFQRLGNNLHQTGVRIQGLGAERELTTSLTRVDRDFIQLYKIELLAGHDFRESDKGKGFLVNEVMAKELLKNTPGVPVESLIGKPFGLSFQDTLGTIIGITRNFNFNSLHNKIETLTISNLSDNAFPEMSVRANSMHMTEALKQMESSWKKIIPDVAFEYHFLDEDFENMYLADSQLSEIVGILSVIAIIIASMGLFGLAAYSVEKRTKEIGVRKVLGASVQNINFLLTRDFLKLVLISNCIAWPIAWFVLQRWLQNFAFKIELNLGVFLLTAIVATSIALITISFQTIKAAVANPVKSLRTE